MENRFEKFTYLIMKLAKLIQRIKNIEMEEFGLKAVHVMCIYQLNKHQEGLTSKALVDLTLEDKAAISRALAYLKENEFINYTNGYNALITLTNKGKDMADYIIKKSSLATDKSSSDLSDVERNELYESLIKIENNMEEYYHKISGKK